MLKCYAVLFQLFLASAAFGQLTLGDEYFPAAGDTLMSSRAEAGFTVDLLTPGANREWDFGVQPSADDLSTVIRSIEGDSPFPEATLTVAIDSNNRGYYRVTDTSYELVGIAGSIPAFSNFEFAAPVNPARPERRAPLSLGVEFATNTKNTIQVAIDSLPPEARQEFGSLLTGVDSIRITSTSVRQDLVDASGTLTINGETYQVLRERRTETLNTIVEVRIGAIGYQNITGAVQLAAPEFRDFFGQQEPVTTYQFWSATEKEPIASVTVDDSDAPIQMTFIRADAINSVGGFGLPQASVSVYPNPARDWATFQLDGLEPGEYTLRVINIMGRKVSTSQFSPVGERAQVDVDVSQLPRGPYLYSVTNERGRILTTRRLLVGG